MAVNLEDIKRLIAPTRLLVAGFLLFSAGLIWVLLPVIRSPSRWSVYMPLDPIPERLMGLGLALALIGLGLAVAGRFRRKP